MKQDFRGVCSRSSWIAKLVHVICVLAGGCCHGMYSDDAGPPHGST